MSNIPPKRKSGWHTPPWVMKADRELDEALRDDDERRRRESPICAECGDRHKHNNPVQWTAVTWPGDRYFEGYVHRDCQDPLMERLEREWNIPPSPPSGFSGFWPTGSGGR